MNISHYISLKMIIDKYLRKIGFKDWKKREYQNSGLVNRKPVF